MFTFMLHPLLPTHFLCFFAFLIISVRLSFSSDIFSSLSLSSLILSSSAKCLFPPTHQFSVIGIIFFSIVQYPFDSFLYIPNLNRKILHLRSHLKKNLFSLNYVRWPFKASPLALLTYLSLHLLLLPN